MSGTTVKNTPVVLIATSFVILGAMAFATKFVVSGFMHERFAYASLRTQINDIEHKRDQLALAQTSAQNINSDVSRVERAFVNQNDILNALIPLEQKAASVGISSYKVTVAQDISSSGLSIAATAGQAGQTSTSANSPSTVRGTTLRIEGTGTLENLFSFLQSLQALPYLLQVESLQLQQTAVAGSSGVGPLQATIIVKFFSVQP